MKKLEIWVESENIESILSGVEYAMQQIKSGYTSGSLGNEDNEGGFDITNLDQ